MRQHNYQMLRLAVRTNRVSASVMRAGVTIVFFWLLSNADGAVPHDDQWPPALHDWTVSVPFVRMSFGVVEQSPGDSRVYLGVVDFPCAVGARTVAGVFGGICFVTAMLAARALARRGARAAG